MQVWPVAAKTPGDDAVGGGVEVGVLEHDLRGLAAELERDPRVRWAIAALRDLDARRVEPVKATLSTPGCAASAAPDIRRRCR